MSQDPLESEHARAKLKRSLREVQDALRTDLAYVRDHCPEDLVWAQGPQGGPKVVEKFECISQRKVVQVACGEKHTVVRTDKGEVFAFGDNQHGQLGLDRSFFEKQIQVRAFILSCGVYKVRRES